MAEANSVETSVVDGVADQAFTQSSFLRRRRFIIDSKLQFGLIGAFFLLLSIFLFVLTATIFGPPVADLLMGETEGHALLKSSRQLLALDARYWPALGISALLIMMMAIRVTHRLAGPLYRFKAIFRELGGSDVPRRFKLREGDYLMNEAGLLNDALDRLRRKSSATLELRSELETFEKQLMEAGDDASAKAVQLMIENYDRNARG